MTHYDAAKTYSYIKGFAMGLHFKNTVKALAFARAAHDGQNRKNGEAYIIHPLTVASHAVALGINSDEVLATALLHDVVEDCGVSINDLPVSKQVKEAVKLLTFVKPSKFYERDKEGPKLSNVKKDYYNAISCNRTASIIKILDRCHNVSSMAGTFTEAKLVEYIEETEEYVLPLIRSTKDAWPELSDKLFVLKYHIQSVTDSISEALNAYKNKGD